MAKYAEKIERCADTVYLDADHHALLVSIARKTRIPKVVLYREAVENLLAQYGALKGPKRWSGEAVK